MEKIVIITGPTAVGKTKLSLAVAKYFDTDIINADAMQIYQKMNIGVAKATIEERRKIKHHFIDFLDPLNNFSIYEYQKGVRKLITKLIDNQKIPLLVGGSGLYLDSVIYNYQLKGVGRDYKFEETFQSLSNEELHLKLSKLNPSLALTIHPNNRKRVLRALAINDFKQDAKSKPLYDALIIFLTDERASLYEAINQRVDEMFNEGLLDEVESLFPDQLSTQALGAIGYKELFRYFKGEWTLDEAKDKIKQATRNYAKRQWTWYNKREDVLFVPINRTNFNHTIEEVINLINSFFQKC